jgi:hypothetical protein
MTTHKLIKASEPGWEEEWLPIETKPPFVPCEERGIYNHNGDGLFYFRPTHWRPLPDDPLPLKAKG